MTKLCLVLCCVLAVTACATTNSIDSAIKISHYSASTDSKKLNLTAKPSAFDGGAASNPTDQIHKIKATSFEPSSLTFLGHALCFFDCTRLLGKSTIVEKFEATITTTTSRREPVNSRSNVVGIQAGDAVVNAVIKLLPDHRLFWASAKIVISIDGKPYTGAAEASADDIARAVVLATNSAAFSLIRTVE